MIGLNTERRYQVSDMNRKDRVKAKLLRRRSKIRESAKVKKELNRLRYNMREKITPIRKEA